MCVSAMFTPHRVYQPCAHFIRTARSLQVASYGVTSSPRLSFEYKADRHHHLLRIPSSITFAKTFDASFATMAKIKVSIIID